MKIAIGLTVFLVVCCECQGQLLSTLFGATQAVHNHVHNNIKDVANTVLGGLPHGGGSLGFNFHIGAHQNQKPQQKPNPDTVVVIVEKEKPSGPHEDDYDGNNCNGNECSEPNENYHGHNHGNPHYGNGNYPNHHHGNGNYPNHHHGNGNYPNHHHGNGNKDPNNQHGNENYPNNHGNGNKNPNNQPGNENHPNMNNQDIENSFPYVNGNNGNKNPPNTNQYGTIHNENNEDNHKKEDEPTRVDFPSPNLFDFGKDKTSTSSPKRDTENKPAAEEEFDLDERFGDKN